jgi:hypothetical protein
MRFLGLLVGMLVCALGSATALCQDTPGWNSRIVADEAQGTSYVELSLKGTYLTPPSVVAAQPALVIECANGKVRENYFSFGAVLSHHAGGLYPVELEAHIDNVRRPIGVQDLSPDGTAAYFPRRELKRMLAARKVLVGAVEFAGPQMLASFSMPDSSPVFSACGHDFILKQK